MEYLMDDQLQNPRYRNWVRATLGLRQLQLGLHHYVDKLAREQHAVLLGSMQHAAPLHRHVSPCHIQHNNDDCTVHPIRHLTEKSNRCVCCDIDTCRKCGLSHCRSCGNLNLSNKLPKKCLSCDFKVCADCTETICTKCCSGLTVLHCVIIDQGQCLDKDFVHGAPCVFAPCILCKATHCTMCNVYQRDCCTCCTKSIGPYHNSRAGINAVKIHRNCKKSTIANCLKNACGYIYDEIINEHRARNPIWVNTDPQYWRTSYWEVAKCFLSCGGYSKCQSAMETDAAGLLSICINSNYIYRHLCNVPDFLQAKSNRDDLFHSCDFELSDCDLQSHLGNMLKVLEGTPGIQSTAQTSIDCISKLKHSEIEIRLEDSDYAQKEAKTAIKQLCDEHRIMREEHNIMIEEHTRMAEENRKLTEKINELDKAMQDQRNESDAARTERKMILAKIETLTISLTPKEADSVKGTGEVLIDIENVEADDEKSISNDTANALDIIAQGKDVDMNDEVNKTLKNGYNELFEENKRVTGARSKCVHLTIECTTLTALLSLFEECFTEKMTSRLKPLERALQRKYQLPQLRLVARVRVDDFGMSMKDVVAKLSEKVQMKQGSIPDVQHEDQILQTLETSLLTSRSIHIADEGVENDTSDTRTCQPVPVESAVEVQRANYCVLGFGLQANDPANVGHFLFILLEEAAESMMKLFNHQGTSLVEAADDASDDLPTVDIEVRLHRLRSELIQALWKCQEESKSIRDLEQKSDEYQRLEESLRQSIDCEAIIDGKQVLLEARHADSVSSALESIKRVYEARRIKLTSHAKSVISIFGRLKTSLGTIVDQLDIDVRSWQRDFQLKYAGLYATPDLDRLCKTCASVGEFVHNLQREELVDFEQYLTDTEVFKLIEKEFVNLQVKLFQRTFVVTDQDDFIFKFKRKKQPKIVVRILAADSLTELKTSEVKAFLVYENDLNNCYHDNRLDLERIEREHNNFKVKTSKVKLKKSKDGENLEGVFDTLELADNFKRPESSVDQKQVHECRYNIVFVTKVNVGESKKTFWTLSPPVVLTSGANQGCMARASIMWQCFSLKDRIGQLPFPDTENMPWSSIVEMLDLYIRTLSPERGLTPENKHHLKRRLLGRSDKPDDCLVEMKSFCYGKLEKNDPAQKNTRSNSFSFWTWMEANYNLIRKHLLPYWEKGWIHGFLSNKDAVFMLKRVRPVSGMFILRFSDYSIQPSQGMNSSLGFLTACISRMKTTPDGRQHVKIVHYNVTGHGAIKTSHLKQILKECIDKKHGPVYKVLYPGPLTREETFDTITDDDSSAEKSSSDSLVSYDKFDIKRVTDLDEAFSDSGIGSPVSFQELDDELIEHPWEPITACVRNEHSFSFNVQGDIVSETSIAIPSVDAMTVRDKINMIFKFFKNLPQKKQAEVAKWFSQQVADVPCVRYTYYKRKLLSE